MDGEQQVYLEGWTISSNSNNNNKNNNNNNNNSNNNNNKNNNDNNNNNNNNNINNSIVLLGVCIHRPDVLVINQYCHFFNFFLRTIICLINLRDQSLGGNIDFLHSTNHTTKRKKSLNNQLQTSIF